MNRACGIVLVLTLLLAACSVPALAPQWQQKIQLGEADAGVVYSSDTVGAEGLLKIEIPAGSNVIARYPLAGLTQAPKQTLSKAFIDVFTHSCAALSKAFFNF